MNHGVFQLNKIRRAIKTQGVSVYIETPNFDEFNEPIGSIPLKSLRGVFHEVVSFGSYSPRNLTDASTTNKETYPMLLCLWEDVADLIPLKDELFYNGKTYKISEVKNIGESNLIADLSLEEVNSDG